MYACLNCGKVHTGKLKTATRHEQEQKRCGPGPGGFSCGGNPEAIFKDSYFKCSNCDEESVVKSVIIKEFPMSS